MPVRKHPIAMSSAPEQLAHLPLDLGLVGRLRATYARVRAQDLRLAEIFYGKLFAAAPPLRAMFGADLVAQAQKLTLALDAVVDNLENPSTNTSALAELGKRHAGYGVTPQNYDLVIGLLVESMEELLGPGADRRGLEDWRMALRLISNHMISGAGDKV